MRATDGVARVEYAHTGDVHLAYQVVGSGPPDLVLVGEWSVALDGRWDEPVMAAPLRRLASFSRLISFDRRGVGCSDRVPLDVVATPEEWTDDICTVMDHAGVGDAFVMASTSTGPLALLFAATHPERARGVVLVNGYARHPSHGNARALQEVLDTVEQGWGGAGDVLAELAPSVAGDDELCRRWASGRRRQASLSTARALFTMEALTDVRAVLPLVQCPTLVLHNRNDIVPRAAADELVAAIADARLVELPGRDYLWWGSDAAAIVDEVEEFVTGARGSQEPDRALATMLFSDIVSSTERAGELGDRRWRDLLDRHNDLVRRQLERFHGTEVKTTGDGFLAMFDGPARAVRCGLAVCEAVGALDLAVRVGIHAGEVEIQGGDIAGIAVHIAARVSAEAGSGEVLVSRTVKDLVAGSGIRFEDRGTRHLKGVDDDWQVFAASGA